MKQSIQLFADYVKKYNMHIGTGQNMNAAFHGFEQISTKEVVIDVRSFASHMGFNGFVDHICKLVK